MELLNLKNLEVAINGLKIIRGVDLVVHKGEIHGILGESGSGKTVTAYAIARLHEAKYSGQILYRGDNILELDENRLSTIRGYNISYIFQNPHEAFNPYKKLSYQLREAMIIHGLEPDQKLIEQAMSDVGLNNMKILKKYPHQISGGECQRVMIAMSILCEPEIIIADEPTSSIDAANKKQILNLLYKLNKDKGTTIIMITHDMGLIDYFCHHVSIMYGGLILEQGSVEKILTEARHPYTKALIRCSESLEGQEETLYTLKGTPISPKYYTDACPFYDRCPYKAGICLEGIPDVKQINGFHYRCKIV